MTWLCYVTFDDVPAYEAKGWKVHSPLGGNHGFYCCLMEAGPEAWLPVVGWAGFYEVSNTGLVRSLDRIVASRGGSRTIPGRVLRHGATQGGYLQVGLKRAPAPTVRRYIAHLVAEAWLGKRPDGYDVCHNDGNRQNNHADNLRYDTRVGNAADMVMHGTRIQGEVVHASKLTDADVREIRRLAVTHEHADLARQFGVTRNNIDFIVNRRMWKHLSPGADEVGTPEADAARKRRIKQNRAERMAAMNRLRGGSHDLGGRR